MYLRFTFTHINDSLSISKINANSSLAYIAMVLHSFDPSMYEQTFAFLPECKHLYEATPELCMLLVLKKTENLIAVVGVATKLSSTCRQACISLGNA